MKINWTPRIKINTTGVSSLKEKPGVYRLVYLDPKDNNYYVFYVGQADNLKYALAQHLPWRETNPHLAYYLKNFKCFFRAASVQEKSNRDRTEVALYKHFMPSTIKIITNLQPATVNFE